MPSIIDGFNYDIFISYRQKDNKYDGWVSEFVENLKMELDAIFKEDISVYFDNNPHDGLLESHEVSESLKNKLKCLIFIPVISRTYCDPNSFAWQNEFTEFVKLASSDRYGLKIKIPGGNVASRVLPVRIYDLNREDISLFESVLGGVLRGIEFIYKSPGVNRPLRGNEDHSHENLNKTYYRDQINKVAYSVQDIINGLKVISDNSFDKQEDQKSNETNVEKVNHVKSFIRRNPISKRVLITIISILFFLCASFLAYYYVILQDSVKILDKSISLMDPYNVWPNYKVKIRLRNIRLDTESDEIIEMDRLNKYYSLSVILKDSIYISGFRNGAYFGELWKDGKKVKDMLPDEDNIEIFREHHSCHLALLMELKNSGLKMSKKAKRVQFTGEPCFSIEFKSDSSQNLHAYFKNTNWIVYISRSDFSLKGLRYENLFGSSDGFRIVSGIDFVNQLAIPRCSPYYNTSEKQFMGVDIFTIVDQP